MSLSSSSWAVRCILQLSYYAVLARIQYSRAQHSNLANKTVHSRAQKCGIYDSNSLSRCVCIMEEAYPPGRCTWRAPWPAFVFKNPTRPVRAPSVPAVRLIDQSHSSVAAAGKFSSRAVPME